MVKISCSQAKKLFFAGKPFLVCPVKLRPDGPFSPALLVLDGKEWLEKAKSYENNPKLWEGSVEKTAWQLFLNNWKYYNASYETGYYPAYYVED